MLLLLACLTAPDSSTPEEQESRAAESTGSTRDSAGCAGEGGGAGQDPLSLPGEVACGAAIYQDHCTGCHGPDGLGGENGPSLLEHVHCHTDAELMMVLTGQRPKMPDPGLGSQQLADVLAWLRQTYGTYTGPNDTTCPEF